MHEDIDDFEPDWESYHSMGDEERQVRKDKYKIFLKYSDGKITYDKYIQEIDDPYFYGVLSEDEWIEVRKLHEDRKENRTLKQK